MAGISREIIAPCKNTNATKALGHKKSRRENLVTLLTLSTNYFLTNVTFLRSATDTKHRYTHRKVKDISPLEIKVRTRPQSATSNISPLTSYERHHPTKRHRLPDHLITDYQFKSHIPPILTAHFKQGLRDFTKGAHFCCLHEFRKNILVLNSSFLYPF